MIPVRQIVSMPEATEQHAVASTPGAYAPVVRPTVYVDDGKGGKRPETRMERMTRLRVEASAAGPQAEKAPQCIIKASVDEETGDIIIRIPANIDPKHVQPASTDKSLVVKYRVDLPKDTLLQIDWPTGEAYHRVGGDNAKEQTINLNLIAGLKDDFAPAKIEQ